MRQFAVGTFTGTGAIITVELGWQPDYVKVYNDSDAGNLAPVIEHFKGMPAASGLKSLKSVDNGATGNASSARVTTNGITINAGDTTVKAGFKIGADADVNVNGEAGYWVAFRGP
jgi:hypothetical protein